MKNNWLNLLRRLGALGLLVLLTFPALAQTATDAPEMADAMRQNGKIYVVVAVILLILFGLLAYLIRIDRKVGQLEQELRDGA